MQSFNHFQIKRKARIISRQSAGTPFGHIIQWDKKRNSTFPADIESGRAAAAAEAGNHDTSFHLTPVNSGGGGSHPSRDGDKDKKCDSSTTAPGAEPASSGGEGLLRNRRPEPRLDTNLTPDGTGHIGGQQEEAEETKKKGSRFLKHIEPKEPFTVANQLERLLNAWVNFLLLCWPIGLALTFTRFDKSVVTFAVNILAAVPLLVLNDFGLVEIGLRIGETAGNLLYNTCANLVLLITCILLITSGQGHLVQFALAGSILTNILFVLGISIVCGGIRRTSQFFNQQVAHISANMLSLGATSLLIPTASNLLKQASPENLVKQSRGAAFILILVFVLYVIFQTFTHRHIFNEESQKVPISTKPKAEVLNMKKGLASVGLTTYGLLTTGLDNERILMRMPVTEMEAPEDDEDNEEPQLHFLVAIFTFAATTVMLYFCIDFAVASIGALTAATGISQTFVGLILLPLPNCDFTPISVAIADKLDLTMNCTIGKCLQTALLVTPLSVLVGWAVGDERVTLVFNGFEIVSLFAAILLLNFLVSDGKVSWIQGAMLLADWGLIAIAAFFATT